MIFHPRPNTSLNETKYETKAMTPRPMIQYADLESLLSEDNVVQLAGERLISPLQQFVRREHELC